MFQDGRIVNIYRILLERSKIEIKIKYKSETRYNKLSGSRRWWNSSYRVITLNETRDTHTYIHMHRGEKNICVDKCCSVDFMIGNHYSQQFNFNHPVPTYFSIVPAYLPYSGNRTVLIIVWLIAALCRHKTVVSNHPRIFADLAVLPFLTTFSMPFP